eukprot:12240485-Heterocapsa_arctica.AAC.1
MLGEQLGLCSGGDTDDNLINVLEIYRAPRCLRCAWTSTSRWTSRSITMASHVGSANSATT